MQVFGVAEFASRIGPAAGAWVMGASLYLGVRRWHGAHLAGITLLVLATCPLYFVAAQYVNHDMLVAGLITAAILAWVRGFEQPAAPGAGWLVLGWLACAGAVLAKGLIGMVLPLLVVGPWLLVQGGWLAPLRLLQPLGVLVFVIVAVPWFVAIQMRFPGFFDYFFIEQHFRRFAQSTFNNVKPFWFFLAMLPLLTLPWSVRLVSAARLVWRRRDPRAILYVWWVLVVVGFFSLPSSKLVGYGLPALAPWCALLAMSLASVRPRVLGWIGGAAALLCLLIVAGLTWQGPKSNRGVALALAGQIAPGEPVVMVDDYFYDVPFYARLPQPVIVAGSWTDPAFTRRDSWRKELFEAGRFQPQRARELLQPLSAATGLACGSKRIWFIVEPAAAQQVADLPGAARVFADAASELWFVAAAPCR
ncbi:MAG: glycosyltransferase family 39 protein, partial [Rhodoferax sp.]|nr:glycosyltransferase family 39 protein [Rhodoferax sp.]